MDYTFLPEIKTIGKIEDRFGTAKIAKEPMIYSGDWDFTAIHGGPITRLIMGHLLASPEWHTAYSTAKREDLNVVIDTRSNMLMKGMYPSIPGWHCDDVPRSEKYAQPDLNLISDEVQHFMVLLSDNARAVARTEFIAQPTIISIDENDVWNSVNEAIEARPQIKKGYLEEGDIIRFSQKAIHRASLCEHPGWRFFFRASITHRKPANEIRNQVQVYVTRSGW